jgi:hypothetical protein
MTRISTTLLLFIAITCIVLVAGCTSPFNQTNQSGNTTPAIQPLPASYKVTIAQPDERSRLLHMDTDVYNQGEVVEFFIADDNGRMPFCTNDTPAFSVKFQKGNGAWATKMDVSTPPRTNELHQGTGKTSPMYGFVTTGWEPNRYRIVSDCGISREFIVRTLPTLEPTICPVPVNEPLWVRINPIDDQYSGKKFSISGTTNRAVGEELKYLVFPSSMVPKNLTEGNEKPLSIGVSEGLCGENTWSVDLDRTIPQEYFFMISAGSQDATAIQRFTIVPAPSP